MIALVIIVLGLLSGWAVGNVDDATIRFTGFQLTSDVAVQEQPDIYGVNI